MIRQNSHDHIRAPLKPQRLGRWETFMAAMKGEGSEEWRSLEAERRLDKTERHVQNELVLAHTASQRTIAVFEQQVNTLEALHLLAANTASQCPKLQDAIDALLLQSEQSYARVMAAAQQLDGRSD